MKNFTSFLFIFVFLIIFASLAIVVSFLAEKLFHLTRPIVKLSSYIVVSAFVVLVFSQVFTYFSLSSEYKNIIILMLVATLATWGTILLRKNKMK